VPPDLALVVMRAGGGRCLDGRHGEPGDGQNEHDFTHGIPLWFRADNNPSEMHMSNRAVIVNGERLLPREQPIPHAVYPSMRRGRVIVASMLLAGGAAMEPQGGAPVALVNSAGQPVGSVRAWQT